MLKTILMHLITNAELHAYPQTRGLVDILITRRSQGCRRLGLAVVESLVSGALGSKLEIRSEPGHGTRVILRIPVQAPPLETIKTD